MVGTISISGSKRPDWQTREQERLQNYAAARDFYAGVQWIGRPQRGETRITINYARALIKKSASYTLPSPVTFTAITHPDQAGDDVETILGDYLQSVSAHELDVALVIEAATIGDAAVKITWDPQTMQPVIGQVDPATLAADWNPTNPAQIYAITQHYQLTGQAISDLIEIDTTGLNPRQLYPIKEVWSDTTWSIDVEGQLAKSGPNPYGWIPYVILANERPPRSLWGESDLIDLYDVCRELNARISTLSKIMVLSGAPIAVIENVDSSEGIAVGPGAKWELPEGAKAYLLDLLSGNGVSLHIDNLNNLIRAVHDISETPRTAFGDSGRTLSGAALEVEIQPLVQKVRRKRTALERFYQTRNARILDLLERFGGQPIKGIRHTRPIWPQILPSDEDANVRNQAQLVAAQIRSKRSAAVALGSDEPDAELAQIKLEMALLAEPTLVTPTTGGTTPA